MYEYMCTCICPLVSVHVNMDKAMFVLWTIIYSEVSSVVRSSL